MNEPRRAFGPGSGVPEHDEQPRLGELLVRSSRGDEAAFAELYDLTSVRIHGLVLRVIRAPDLAAEVVQEVYVELWRLSARYRAEEGSAMGWMCTVAHRRAVDRIRSVQRDTVRDDRWSQGEQAEDSDDVWAAVEHRLDVEQVRRGITSLTPAQREALTLAYYGGYTHTQVADLLDLPLGTTKSRIRDGLIGLRDALGVNT